MKLNNNILYYHLSQTYRLAFVSTDDSSYDIGRPRLYRKKPIPGCLCLVEPGVKELPGGTYLCFDRPKLLHPESTACFYLPEGTDSGSVYNQVQEIFDLYDDWENSCLQALEKYSDYRSLIRLTYEMLHVPVCLFDNQFAVIAAAYDEDKSYALFSEDREQYMETVDDLIANPHLRNLELQEGVFDFDYDRNYKLYNFYYGEQYCGRLAVAVDDTEFSQRCQLIAEHLAEFIELLLNRFGTFQFVSSAQTQLHRFLSESMSGKTPSSGELTALFQNTGWAEGNQYLMIWFLPEHRLKKTLYAPYLISQIEGLWKGACAVEYRNNVVLLQNLTVYGADRKPAFFQSLAYLVRDGLMIAGISRPFEGLTDLPNHFREAEYAIHFGQIRDSTKWYFRFEEYGLDYLLTYGLGIFRPEQVCHPALLYLKEHDRLRQTSYYETLYMYFRQQFNMSHAASRLYIHRSTFINRMERILELTHLKLEDFDTRLHLEISFRIMEGKAADSSFYV